MLVTITLLLLALLICGTRYVCKNGIKLPDVPQAQNAKPRKTKPKRTWSHTDKYKNVHSRKAKVYVAPVIQKKWRTPRRTSH